MGIGALAGAGVGATAMGLPTLSSAHVELDAAIYAIKYLFSPREAATLSELLGRLVETTAAATAATLAAIVMPTPTTPQQAEVADAGSDGSEGGGVVMYATLLELLLDFQLQRHLVVRREKGGGDWSYVGALERGRVRLASPKGRTLSPGRRRTAQASE